MFEAHSEGDHLCPLVRKTNRQVGECHISKWRQSIPSQENHKDSGKKVWRNRPEESQVFWNAQYLTWGLINSYHRNDQSIRWTGEMTGEEDRRTNGDQIANGLLRMRNLDFILEGTRTYLLRGRYRLTMTGTTHCFRQFPVPHFQQSVYTQWVQWTC